MSWLRGMFAGDEELGKKNDDHRPLNGAAAPAPWSARRAASGMRKRRIFYGICALLFLYVFVKNIPTDLGPSSRSVHNPGPGDARKLPSQSSDNPNKKPKRPVTPSAAEEHYHDGPIKFYKLALSLHSVARLGGQHEINKNVLFAASNLKSASEIIPLACEMARWDRNDVHLAIMGRDDMDIAEIKKINGVEEDCNVHWHDARPDYSRWSSDVRMEVSVTAGVAHIQTFIHPQVIIIDNPSREDPFFVTALRSKAMDIGKAVIELPVAATENLMWITRLDSASLAAWRNAYVDVLIQAPAGSSGSLVRLLKSIENADYFGIRRPHLTIELPTEIDPPTWRYLENMVWPPLDWSGAAHASQVTLRHRIARRTTTEYEASARFVESFYPARIHNSHVLLLSPQVELSPLYYHYLIYNLLEYKYSTHGKAAKESSNVIGFSLELPSFYLNDSTPLIPPLKPGKAKEPMPFLWQAPNSNAALYFGDRWVEFHSFLQARLSKPPPARRKVISDKHPAWMEFLLEFMRARGFSLIYPNFPTEGDTIATIHDELYQIPEEFPKDPAAVDNAVPDLDPSQPLVKDYDASYRRAPPNTETALLSSSNLISLLPNSGDLSELSDMLLISYNGYNMSRELSREAAAAFSQAYQREVGGCDPSAQMATRKPDSAVDLFCHLDEVYDPLQHLQQPVTVAPIQDEIVHMDQYAIPAGQHENAKAEASAHLGRQGGTLKPLPPLRTERTMQEAAIAEDAGKERQTEFQMQMERQAKQAGNEDRRKHEVETKEEKKEEPKQDAPSPTHQGFSKQAPKVALEDPQAEAASGKGAGW